MSQGNLVYRGEALPPARKTTRFDEPSVRIQFSAEGTDKSHRVEGVCFKWNNNRATISYAVLRRKIDAANRNGFCVEIEDKDGYVLRLSTNVAEEVYELLTRAQPSDGLFPG